jgi:hypothetical protein
VIIPPPCGLLNTQHTITTTQLSNARSPCRRCRRAHRFVSSQASLQGVCAVPPGCAPPHYLGLPPEACPSLVSELSLTRGLESCCGFLFSAIIGKGTSSHFQSASQYIHYPRICHRLSLMRGRTAHRLPAAASSQLKPISLLSFPSTLRCGID